MIYAYYRVSTDEQDYQNQKLGVVRFCESHNFIIDEVIIDDGISGTVEPEKRHLNKILSKIKTGDIIVCSELSRLGRKLFMIIRILEHCLKVGAKIYTVKDNFVLEDNIQSKVLSFAFGLSAEIERELISMRTKEALARVKASGKHLGRPFGFRYCKLSKYKDRILGYIDKGLNACEMARRLGCSPNTVKRYLKQENLYNRWKESTQAPSDQLEFDEVAKFNAFWSNTTTSSIGLIP